MLTQMVVKATGWDYLYCKKETDLTTDLLHRVGKLKEFEKKNHEGGLDPGNLEIREF